MAPRDQISLGLNESTAFKKLEGGIKQAIEGCTELGMYRSDKNWITIATVLQKVLLNVQKLFNNSVTRRIRWDQ